MKTITVQRYACGVCGKQYESEKSALRCEKKPVTHDDVKIGDVVLITGGEGKGERLKVEEKWTVDMEWGHHRADRYHHTVCVSGSVIDSWGSRVLTFDQRAPCPASP
jgi:hypothetical protein